MGLGLGLLALSLLSDPGRPPPAALRALTEAEGLLFAADLDLARRRLLELDAPSPEIRERRARLLFDLAVAAADGPAARRWARELPGNTGWEPYVELGLDRVARRQSRLDWARAGVFGFALAFGLLLLGGGRELLRPGRAVWIALIGGALGLLLTLPKDPALGLRLGMTAIAGTALIHAAEAALRRHAAGPKWRLMVATTVLLGTAGVGLAAFLAEASL